MSGRLLQLPPFVGHDQIVIKQKPMEKGWHGVRCSGRRGWPALLETISYASHIRASVRGSAKGARPRPMARGDQTCGLLLWDGWSPQPAPGGVHKTFVLLRASPCCCVFVSMACLSTPFPAIRFATRNIRWRCAMEILGAINCAIVSIVHEQAVTDSTLLCSNMSHVT